MKVHSRQTVHDLLQDQWESDLPDKVIEALRPLEGKAITTRLLAKLPANKQWRLIRHYGWTSLQTTDYGDSRDGMDLMLVRSEASVPLDLKWVEDNNSAYFSARKERNHARMEAMNTRETLDTIAAAMNEAERAIAALRAVDTQIDKLTEYGTTLNPDRYTIQRACGLSDRDGRPILAHDYKERL